MQTLPKFISRHEFPQLNQILWDNHSMAILPQEALHYYETRWRYVDKSNLSPQEADLLKLLIQEYGKGLFLTA